MTFLLFAGMVLASYRIVRMFQKDSLFDRQRNWFYLQFPPNSDFAGWKKYGKGWFESPNSPRSLHKLGQLIECPWCIGFWVAGAVTLIVANCISMQLPIIWWLATSTAVGLLAKLDG